MSSTGFLQLHAYTSSAQLPLRDVSVLITSSDQTAIAMRLTDRSGLISPIEIPVPDKEESQEPGSKTAPYTLINLYARKSGYEPIYAENIQIFAQTTTIQDLEMVPLAEQNRHTEIIVIDTPMQDL